MYVKHTHMKKTCTKLRRSVFCLHKRDHVIYVCSSAACFSHSATYGRCAPTAALLEAFRVWTGLLTCGVVTCSPAPFVGDRGEPGTGPTAPGQVGGPPRRARRWLLAGCLRRSPPFPLSEQGPAERSVQTLLCVIQVGKGS